jgi:uncharacterized protein (DUF362 family)
LHAHSSHDGAVAVARGDDPYANATAALAALPRPDWRGKRVLVKPNCGRVAAPETGIVTHPQAVAAAVDFARACGASAVAVGESPILGVDVAEAFRAAGVEAVCRECDVPLVDLDEARPVSVPVPGGVAVKELRVCRGYDEADVVFSVPVMKTHMHTGVTLAVKNMKGVLWRREKVRLHQLHVAAREAGGGRALDVAIADMATVVRPHFCLVDGFVGMEGLGPSAGTPRDARVALAGADAVAVDAAACRLMGMEARDVAHLRLAAARGAGSLEARVVPGGALAPEIPFARPPLKISVAYPNVVVHEGDACSACLSTVLMLLQRYEAEISEYFPADAKLHIAIGKAPEKAPEDALFVGNCALEGRRCPFGAKGCPPVASDLMALIRKRAGG